MGVPSGPGSRASHEAAISGASPAKPSVPNAGLSGGAFDTFYCLFVHGATFDGDVPSKSGRDELFRRRLAMGYDGYQTLTINGLKLALKLGFDRRKEKYQRERRERSNALAGIVSRALASVARTIRQMRSDLAQYDYLLPGDYVPDPPLRKRWFRWRPAFVVTNDLLIWAGDVARARSLMDLEAAASAIEAGDGPEQPA